MPSELASNTTQATANRSDQQTQQMEATPLKAQKPSGDEVEVEEVFVTVARAVPAPELVAAVPVAVLVQSDSPAELPATASPLPLFGLIGLLSLASGITLRVACRGSRIS
jgi:hypothetical protein